MGEPNKANIFGVVKRFENAEGPHFYFFFLAMNSIFCLVGNSSETLEGDRNTSFATAFKIRYQARVRARLRTLQWCFGAEFSVTATRRAIVRNPFAMTLNAVEETRWQDAKRGNTVPGLKNRGVPEFYHYPFPHPRGRSTRSGPGVKSQPS